MNRDKWEISQSFFLSPSLSNLNSNHHRNFSQSFKRLFFLSLMIHRHLRLSTTVGPSHCSFPFFFPPSLSLLFSFKHGPWVAATNLGDVLLNFIEFEFFHLLSVVFQRREKEATKWRWPLEIKKEKFCSVATAYFSSFAPPLPLSPPPPPLPLALHHAGPRIWILTAPFPP